MTAMLRRLVFELGTGRATENARQEQQQLELVHARIEALGRRLHAPTVAPATAPAATGNDIVAA